LLAQLFDGKTDDGNKEPLSRIKTAKERLTSLLDHRNLPELNMEASAEDIQRNAKEMMIMVKSFLPSFNDDENKKNEIVESIRLIIQETNKLTGYGMTR